MPRNFSISSGDSGGRAVGTMFIAFLVPRACSIPFDRGAAQPVIDRFTQPVIGNEHQRDGFGAPQVELAKIAEKIAGGFIDVAAWREIEVCGDSIGARDRVRS